MIIDQILEALFPELLWGFLTITVVSIAFFVIVKIFFPRPPVNQASMEPHQYHPTTCLRPSPIDNESTPHPDATTTAANKNT